MAVGDAALAAGFAIVNGATDLIKDGDTEINRTRDYLAGIKGQIKADWAIADGGTGANTVPAARTNLGICGAITYGTAAHSGGAAGDVYFKYTP